MLPRRAPGLGLASTCRSSLGAPLQHPGDTPRHRGGCHLRGPRAVLLSARLPACVTRWPWPTLRFLRENRAPRIRQPRGIPVRHQTPGAPCHSQHLPHAAQSRAVVPHCPCSPFPTAPTPTPHPWSPAHAAAERSLHRTTPAQSASPSPSPSHPVPVPVPVLLQPGLAVVLHLHPQLQPKPAETCMGAPSSAG